MGEHYLLTFLLQTIALNIESISTIHDLIRNNISMVKVYEEMTEGMEYDFSQGTCRFRTVLIVKRKRSSYYLRECQRKIINEHSRFCDTHNHLQNFSHELYKTLENNSYEMDGVFLRIIHSLIFFQGTWTRVIFHSPERS